MRTFHGLLLQMKLAPSIEERIVAEEELIIMFKDLNEELTNRSNALAKLTSDWLDARAEIEVLSSKLNSEVYRGDTWREKYSKLLDEYQMWRTGK